MYKVRVLKKLVLNLSVHSILNWNLEVSVFEKRENQEYLEKITQSKAENQQQTQPT